MRPALSDDNAKPAPRLPNTPQGVAETESRQLPAANDEVPRHLVLEALEESLLQYDELYRKLAQ